jgi:hypothetical protein
MHVVESYATTCGLKIDKPFIYEKFVPMVTEKYITFSYLSYSFMQEVIDILAPILAQKDIAIIHLTNSGKPAIYNCLEIQDIDPNESAYVVNHSMLLFGESGFFTDLASFYNKKTVSLHSNCFLENFYSYWGDEENNTYIESEKKNEKPYYNLIEDKPILNSIQPEKIAKKVLESLGIEYTYEYETIFVGTSYAPGSMIKDVVLSEDFQIQLDDPCICIRLDLRHSEHALEQQFYYANCLAEVVCDRPINLNILNKFKKNIKALFYVVTENDNPEFALEVRSLGIPLLLLSYMSKKELQNKKINYMDIGRINTMEVPNLDEILEENDVEKLTDLHYVSSRTIIADKKMFPTEYAFLNNLSVQNPQSISKLFDDPILSKEINHLRLLKKV